MFYVIFNFPEAVHSIQCETVPRVGEEVLDNKRGAFRVAKVIHDLPHGDRSVTRVVVDLEHL